MQLAHRGRKGSPMRRRLTGSLFIAPVILTLIPLTIYPIVQLLWLSLHGGSLIPGQSGPFAGLVQYQRLLSDPAFANALWVTIKFVVIATMIEAVLGFALALLFDAEGSFFEIARTLMLLPAFVTPIVVGLIWVLMLNGDFGLVNHFFSLVGLPALPWLGRPGLALASLVIVDVWQWTPYMMYLTFAGLRSLSTEPVEAARVDGASPFQILRFITWPLVQPVVLTALIFRTLDALKIFGLPMMLTGGGPGEATTVLGIFLYRTAFEENRFAYGAAVGVVMLLLSLAITMVYFRQLSRRHATT